MPNAMIVVAIRMPAEMVGEIRAHQRNVSDFIRLAVRRELIRRQRSAEAEARVRVPTMEEMLRKAEEA